MSAGTGERAAGQSVANERTGLRPWVEELIGGAITSWERTAAGGSRETYFVDVAPAQGEPLALVLRVESGGSFSGTPINVAKEAAVYRALEGTRVPVPHVFGVAPGGAALLMERVAGTADLRSFDDEQRRCVMDEFIDILADMHRLDPADLELPGFTRPTTAEEHATLDLDLWARLGEPIELDPLVRYAGAFLRNHPPSTVTRGVLVHGDTGPGNFLTDGEHVTAVVDVEFAHIGDPMDDLAWLRYRAGPQGFDVDSVLGRYTARSGIAVDERSVAYYDVAVQYRCAVTTSLAVARGGGARGWAPYLLVTERYVLGTAAALSAYLGVVEPGDEFPDPAPTPRAAYYDHLMDGIRTAVRALDDPRHKEDTRNLQILVHFLRAHDQIGRELAERETADLRASLGLAPEDERGLASAAEEAGARADQAVLRYLLRRTRRQAALWQTLLDRPRR